MTSKQIREKFLEFFASKEHLIVSSAPMVVKDDPTLMFTNAGMNQFKDIFLGNQTPKSHRIANTQKCLRVSGKHNDLEEVGHDTYHHTMFEMLGNWSFGNYFKEEAIQWSWEFLTDWMKINPDKLYATVFEGSRDDQLTKDAEAFDCWRRYLPEDRILDGAKKDNFWEMGDTGPCGPCSEIHVDLRDEADRKKTPAQDLINQDHPLVIEIWNLVFIQYNRNKNGDLQPLPQKHVDTGMGFERLCMVLQNKQSNYDTDIFQPIISAIAGASGRPYRANEQQDIAMRVIADHLRAVSFAIADGQLPSNTGAGYVIRRILRRAVRYGYTFLDLKEPFLANLLPALLSVMSDAYPELSQQKDLMAKVITEEEAAFLRTLETGITRLNQIIQNQKELDSKVIHGQLAFELFDTYGFPLDLTQLILEENGLTVNTREFAAEMEKQKSRSRQAAEQEVSDWIVLWPDDQEEFIGYNHLSSRVKITRYRQVSGKKGSHYQLVFNYTPFYAESGGQVGDQGYLEQNGQKIRIKDTQKENNLIIHDAEKLPEDPKEEVFVEVTQSRRINTMRNHSATHLLHHVLRETLGQHVEQKGSLVHPDYLRFDFSHYEKLEKETIRTIEGQVNELIRRNLDLTEIKDLPMSEAKKLGAMALFGEKYGDVVRVIQFGDSVELCGGTHVQATGEIGFFKIVSESSIASGIRRIEAISGERSEQYINDRLDLLDSIQSLFKNRGDVVDSVSKMAEENTSLRKEMDQVKRLRVKQLKDELLSNSTEENGIRFIQATIDLPDPGNVKDLLFQLKGETDQTIAVVGGIFNGKPNISILITEDLLTQYHLHAGNIIRAAAKKMQGGGGGQPFFATAGGKDAAGLASAMKEAMSLIKQEI